MCLQLYRVMLAFLVASHLTRLLCLLRAAAQFDIMRANNGNKLRRFLTAEYLESNLTHQRQCSV